MPAVLEAERGEKMTRSHRTGLLLVFLGSLVFILLGVFMERRTIVAMADFKPVYYGARCLLQHCDPYNEDQLLLLYRSESRARTTEPPWLQRIATRLIYLPTVFTVTIPLALMSFGPAHVVWMIMTASGFILAACLILDLGADYAPRLSGGLLFVILAGSELLIEVGNAAGIAISLSVIAAWCFLRQRFVAAGVLCLAISLLIKPHNAGFVWLYFVLAGGILRKRALQSLLLTIILGFPSVLWVTYISPHWIQEMQSNISKFSVLGDLNDTGVSTLDVTSHGAPIVSLQMVAGVFSDNQTVQNTVAYLVCAPLLLIWVVVSLRASPSWANAWLALAAISALSMLPLYHRQQDTRMLLLTIPASAMLWNSGGKRKWMALLIGVVGLVFTGDLPLQILANLANPLVVSTHGFFWKILVIAFDRPAPVVLLIMSIFYLWTYASRAFDRASRGVDEHPAQA